MMMMIMIMMRTRRKRLLEHTYRATPTSLYKLCRSRLWRPGGTPAWVILRKPVAALDEEKKAYHLLDILLFPFILSSSIIVLFRIHPTALSVGSAASLAMSFRTTAPFRLTAKSGFSKTSVLARSAYTTSSTSSSSSGQTPAPVPVAQRPVKHFLDLHSLSTQQITGLINQAQQIKSLIKPPSSAPHKLQKTLTDKTVALLFSKRSTRTRIASETSAVILGGHPMFLGPADIQLGVNESLKDTAHIIGSMADGIMARVGAHAEVETLAKYSGIPVINALSDLYHPTQTLASLLTLARIYAKRTPTAPHFAPPTPVAAPQAEAPKATASTSSGDNRAAKPPQRTSWNDLWSRAENGSKPSLLTPLQGLKVAWVGDCNNVVNDMIVTYPRLGIDLRVASPGGKEGEYGLDKRVEAKLDEFGLKHAVTFTSSPEEALKDADVVVTDTWISMGQEEESAKRLKDFAGFQITEELCKRAGANPDWKFMHCLPRHNDEVDDEVFYGPRSTVFEEAENRKHTICSVFNSYIGKRSI